MLRITIELVSARTGETTHLGTALISNDGTGDTKSGNYNVRLSRWHLREPFRGTPGQTWRKAKVTGFPRLRLGAWDLLFRALAACVKQLSPFIDEPGNIGEWGNEEEIGTLLEDEDL